MFSLEGENLFRFCDVAEADDKHWALRGVVREAEELENQASEMREALPRGRTLPWNAHRPLPIHMGFWGKYFGF